MTEEDKTKTVGSVSETKEDKSPPDSRWRLHRDIGETSCHWQMYVRVLLMLPCFPFVVTEMKKQGCALLHDITGARSAVVVETFQPKRKTCL